MMRTSRSKRHVNYGAAWIVFEESYHQKTRRLLSVLPPRKSPGDVSEFMRQMYSDRAYAIAERLKYKKSPNSAPYQVMKGLYMSPLHIGHDPWLVGIYANRVLLKGDAIEFTYRILTNSDDPLNPRLEDRTQSLLVE